MQTDYARITLDENTEVDWMGAGWYIARQEFTYASGEWTRWTQLDEPSDNATTRQRDNATTLSGPIARIT